MAARGAQDTCAFQAVSRCTKSPAASGLVDGPSPSRSILCVPAMSMPSARSVLAGAAETLRSHRCCPRAARLARQPGRPLLQPLALHTAEHPNPVCPQRPASLPFDIPGFDHVARSKIALQLLGQVPSVRRHPGARHGPSSPRPDQVLLPERTTALANPPVDPPCSAPAPSEVTCTSCSQFWLSIRCGEVPVVSVRSTPSMANALLDCVPPNATLPATPGTRLMRSGTRRFVGRSRSCADVMFCGTADLLRQ